MRTVTYVKDEELTVRVRACRACGFVYMPGHVKSHYVAATTIDELPNNPRIGTPERRGREFHMAKMAVDILGRRDLEVLVYGAGRSFDNHHIAALPRVRQVAVADIMKIRDDAEFIDVNRPAPRTFDIVIASEVVEHFRDPRGDFARLFEFVSRDGIVVCGTDIRNGGDLSRHRYIFHRDHTSYYTPKALRTIANDAGFHLDFRAPLLGSGKRKRYVVMSRSQQVMENVACYFGAELFPPSEVARPQRLPAQVGNRKWRRPVRPGG